VAFWVAALRRYFSSSKLSLTGPDREETFVAQLSIGDVRRAILEQAGHAPDAGCASTSAAGRIFHEVLAGLMGSQGWASALESDELNDPERLAAYAYEKLLGPRLTAAQASLRERGAETLALWQATQSMCEWLCRLLESAAARGAIRYDAKARAWAGAEHLCRSEQPLEWELRDPHWTASVLVSGVADALLHDPASGRWCVLEFKLGQGHAEADLAQACLYHAMLCASGLGSDRGALAVLSFRPEVEERFYSSAQLEQAHERLRALIGRLAGVLPDGPRPTPPAVAATDAHRDLGTRLVRALRDYGVAVQWNGEVIAGPTFLRFPVVPDRRLKKKAITDRAGELQMQLNLDEPPFIGLSKGRLVMDVQRPDRQTVPFASVCAQIPRPGKTGSSSVPLGVDLNGRLECVDLASPNNPHLLVAGTSGSGKTAWLQMAIAGMMTANMPETLRLVLIDPKRTAFNELKGSRFLFGNKGLVYPPEDRAMDTLEALIEEMEERYRRFATAAAGDLPEYASKTGEVLPRIVCICDEYADLISDRATKKEVEAAITRLGAKARAAGIHLIIATQYPDHKTVGGALKMNLGGRVCLRTTNHTQSSMIINQSGAERLLGKGDLFFLSIGEPVRLQAPYLSAEERAGIFGGAAKTVLRHAL
jgi:hypothetical protein